MVNIYVMNGYCFPQTLTLTLSSVSYASSTSYINNNISSRKKKLFVNVRNIIFFLIRNYFPSIKFFKDLRDRIKLTISVALGKFHAVPKCSYISTVHLLKFCV